MADAESTKANVLHLLAERQREAEVWLAKHHEAMCQAVEHLLPGPAAFAAGLPPQEVWPAKHHKGLLSLPGPAPSPLEAGSPFFRTFTEPETGNSQRVGHAPSEEAGKPVLDSSFVKKLTEPEREPPKDSLYAHILKEKRTTLVETATGVLLILNTLCMFVKLELDSRKASEALGESKGLDMDLGTITMVFDILAHTFNVIFLIELIVKLFIYRSQYFRSAFDVFDFLVVLVTSAELYLLSRISKHTSNISFLRVMRMLRLVRLLRIIRMMNFFQQLRVLMHSMVLSFLSIFWSMLILFLFMLVSALLLSQVLQDFLLDETADLDTRRWAHKYYGSSMKSLYTIYEATFSGCWPSYARVLIEDVSPWYAAFFVPYVTLVIFTLIRLIYALLLKDTLQAATNDADLVAQINMRETKNLVKKLSDIFTEADVSGNGYLDRREFEEILQFPKVKNWMNALGLDTNDTEMIFSILDDGDNPDGKISREEFIHGIMRIKGHVPRQDMLASARDTRRILTHCKSMHAEVISLSKGLSRGTYPVEQAKQRHIGL